MLKTGPDLLTITASIRANTVNLNIGQIERSIYVEVTTDIFIKSTLFCTNPNSYRRLSPAIKGYSLVSIVSTILYNSQCQIFLLHYCEFRGVDLDKNLEGTPRNIFAVHSLTVRSCCPLTRGVKVMV